MLCMSVTDVSETGLYLLASCMAPFLNTVVTSDESRAECVKTWSSYDSERQWVPGYCCAW